jgi:SAM-dependent methyltransferase
MKDLWSNSPQYRAEFQADDEIAATIALLDLTSAKTLADVGCGNGAFSIAAARANPQLKVLAYDVMESAISACRAAAADLPAERFTMGVAPAEKLPIETAATDRALCRAVLHHVADPMLLYAELARVLAPGGLLLLQAPCNWWEPKWSSFMSEFFELMDESHPRRYHTPPQIIAGLNDTGLMMQRADCWPFTINEISAEQRALIDRHNAGERLKLRRSADGGWAVDFYWARVLATRH